ncbi:class A beta-lactamase-related serine hydrolase [Gramella sp. BOM4]|nr:class A beta-lactamase-related serine hydrolase [Christiangramia bathymodioli]
MRFRFSLLLLFFIQIARPQLATQLDSLAPITLKKTNTVGAYISISRSDSTIYSEGFGYRDLENRERFNDSTIFPISSNTKAFNALLLSQLAEEGELDFFSPVSNYLPDFKLKDPYRTQNLTLMDLFTHRAGFPRYDLIYYMLEEIPAAERNEKLVEKLAYIETPVPFRTTFLYGNLQYILAAHLYESQTGAKWEDAVSQHILAPLDMKDSHFDLKKFKNDDNRASAYQDSLAVEIDKIAPLYQVSGMGNMFSSVRDLQKWGEFLINGDDQILSREYLDFNLSGHFAVGYEEPYPGFSALEYGLGWFVFDYFGHKVVMHHGDNLGHQSLVFLMPDDDISGVIVANNNYGRRSFAFTMLFSIMDLISDQELKDWNSLIPSGGDFVPKHPDSLKVDQELSLEDLKEFTGIYQHEGLGEIEIFINDADKLLVKVGHYTDELEAYREDSFISLAEVFDEDYLLRFKRRNEEVTALETDIMDRSQPMLIFTKVGSGVKSK